MGFGKFTELSRCAHSGTRWTTITRADCALKNNMGLTFQQGPKSVGLSALADRVSVISNICRMLARGEAHIRLTHFGKWTIFTMMKR